MRRVVRPQRVKMRQVVLTLELCREARAYLESDTDAGMWLVAPLPNLSGKTPSEWLHERGPTGLRELTYGLVDWSPRLPAGQLEGFDEDEASALLRAGAAEDENVREFARMLAALD
jgi:hypothetical protein